MKNALHTIWWQGADQFEVPQNWRDHLGHFDVQVWDRDSILALVHRSFPDLYRWFVTLPLTENKEGFRQVRMVDVARFLILELQGGLYCDVDFTFHTDISYAMNPYAQNVDMVGFREYYFKGIEGIMTGLLGVKPRVGICEQFVRSRIGQETGTMVLEFCAPAPFGEFIRNKVDPTRVHLYPLECGRWTEEDAVRSCRGPIIANHVQTGSWLDPTLETPWMAK